MKFCQYLPSIDSTVSSRHTNRTPSEKRILENALIVNMLSADSWWEMQNSCFVENAGLEYPVNIVTFCITAWNIADSTVKFSVLYISFASFLFKYILFPNFFDFVTDFSAWIMRVRAFLFLFHFWLLTEIWDRTNSGLCSCVLLSGWNWTTAWHYSWCLNVCRAMWGHGAAWPGADWPSPARP